MRHTTRAVPALVLLLALSACSGEDAHDPESDGSSSDGSAGELDEVRMAGIPAVDIAPIVLGVQEGFFEDEGIELTVEQVDGGPNAVAGVIAGDYQFGFSNALSMVLARSQDIPLVAYAPGIFSTGQDHADSVGLLVPPDSDVTSADQLDGLTIGVPQVRNIGEVTVRESVRIAGGDPGSLEFVEVPGPTLAQAIVDGQTDAMWIGEPQRTQALQEGAIEIASPNVDTMPNFMMSVYFTSETFVADDPDLAARLRTAIDRSLDFAQENPDEVRAVIDTYLELEPEVLSEFVLPRFSSEFDSDSLQTLTDLAIGYDLLEQNFTLDGAIYED